MIGDRPGLFLTHSGFSARRNPTDAQLYGIATVTTPHHATEYIIRFIDARDYRTQAKSIDFPDHFNLDYAAAKGSECCPRRGFFLGSRIVFLAVRWVAS